MTKPPVQAKVTVSPYRLVRMLNLASLHGELDRLYFEIKENWLHAYGFKKHLISYCSFNQHYINKIELERDEPVGVVVNVPSWRDTASRLNNSRDNPETVRDHEIHRSFSNIEGWEERKETFEAQYNDSASCCIIQFHCDQNSTASSHRIITAENRYEDPLPTPRLTLIHWDQVHNIMATYGIDSIVVGNYKIENKFNKEYRRSGFRWTNIFPTPKNERGYGNHDLFYSDQITPEEITKALWSEIKTKVRRRSPHWVFRSISVPDSEISFDVSKLNKISNLFDSNNRFRNPSDLNRVPSSFKTNVDTLEELVEAYDSRLGPPYPVELRDGKFIVDPKYPRYSGGELYSSEASGPAFRKEVSPLDTIVHSLSGEVMFESGPNIPHIAVIKRSNGRVLRYVMPDLK